MNDSNNRWLVIRNGAVGDTLLLSPTLQLIRQNDPHAWVEVLGCSERIDLLRGKYQANAIRPIDSVPFHSLFSVDEPMSQELHNYLAGFSHILYYTNKPKIEYQSRLTVREGQWVKLWAAIPESDTGLHIAAHYAQALDELWEVKNLALPRIDLTEEDRKQADEYLEGCGIKRETCLLLVFHVGAGSERKRVSFEYFHCVLELFMSRFSVHLMLPEGPADEAAVKQFCETLPPNVSFSILKQLPLRKLAAVMSHCDLMVGNDSGVTHIAAAVNCPTVAFFLDSNPIIWQPVGKYVRMLNNC